MGLFSQRIPLSPLADFCDRFGTALQAGVDPRRALDGEIARAPSGLREPLQVLRDELEHGSTLSDAVAKTGDAFPPLFKDLLDVGEQTGKVDETLLRQAQHYRHLKRLRWLFLSLAAWPLIQLGGAIVVIGIFIVLLGTLVPGNHDVLGFGLVGWAGLAKYLVFLGVLGAAGAFALSMFTRDSQRPRIKAFLSHLPTLNGYFTADAMARFCWTMSAVDDAGMDLRKGLKAALRASDNQRFIDPTDAILKTVRQGTSLAEAFRETKAFPFEMVAAVEVGEQSGRLSETLQKLSEQYQKQAESHSYALTTALSFAIWGLVALMLVFLILRIAMFYTGTIYELSQPQ